MIVAVLVGGNAVAVLVNAWLIKPIPVLIDLVAANFVGGGIDPCIGIVAVAVDCRRRGSRSAGRERVAIGIGAVGDRDQVLRRQRMAGHVVDLGRDFGRNALIAPD